MRSGPPPGNDLFKRVNVREGEGCTVDPHCSLENVTLGDHVTIGEGVQLKNVVIGERSRLARRITLYSADPDAPVRIGRECWLGYGIFGEATGGEIRIGDYSAIGQYATLITSSAPGGPGAFSAVLREFFPVRLGPILIGRHCWVGAQSVVLPNAVLTEGVVIGANSTVPAGDWPAWCVFWGNPIRLVRRLDAAAVEAALRKHEGAE